MSNINTHEVL